MVGDGGMGKTTSLIGIMDDAYGEEAEKNDWNNTGCQRQKTEKKNTPYYSTE